MENIKEISTDLKYVSIYYDEDFISEGSYLKVYKFRDHNYTWVEKILIGF
jgi:hypothetical protein